MVWSIPRRRPRAPAALRRRLCRTLTGWIFSWSAVVVSRERDHPLDLARPAPHRGNLPYPRSAHCRRAVAPPRPSAPRRRRGIDHATATDVIINAVFRQSDWATTADGATHVALAAASSDARLVHVSSDAVFSGTRPSYDETDVPDLTTPLVGGFRTGALFTDDVRCPVHVADLASALLELAASPHSGVHHVDGADAISRYELGALIALRDGFDPPPSPPAAAPGQPSPTHRRTPGLHPNPGPAAHATPRSTRIPRYLATRLKRAPTPTWPVTHSEGPRNRAAHCRRHVRMPSLRDEGDVQR
jgi:RmlD substrate binding domain